MSWNPKLLNPMYFLKPLSFMLVLLVSFSGCQQQGAVPIQTRPGKHPVTIAGHKVWCMIAADNASRQRGLMYRSSLPDDEGMLFIFPQEIGRAHV